jgi:hypothetical protein
MARTIFGPVFGQITGQGGAIVQSVPITVPGLGKWTTVHGTANVNSESRIERLIRNGNGLAPKEGPGITPDHCATPRVGFVLLDTGNPRTDSVETSKRMISNGFHRIS